MTLIEKEENKLITDQNYRKWIQDISGRFRRSQIKAASYVNEKMLRFYWSLGHDIHFMENTYGSGLFKKLSHDLKKELPDVKSFSVTNLHYMSWFYELYPDAVNLPQVGVNSEGDNNLPQDEVNGVNLSKAGIFSLCRDNLTTYLYLWERKKTLSRNSTKILWKLFQRSFEMLLCVKDERYEECLSHLRPEANFCRPI